jgi:hypothetical protein
VWRSQIVLLAGGGFGAVDVATRVGKSILTVRRWRRQGGGWLDERRLPSARAQAADGKIKQVVNLTLNEKPPDATHWSERSMAARASVGITTLAAGYVATNLLITVTGQMGFQFSLWLYSWQASIL